MLSYIDEVRNIFSARELAPRCFVRSFGCQQNVSDGEKVIGLLCSMGCCVTDEINNADVIIYNTCAVRENAELKIYGLIGELKHLKENNPDLIIGFCGCMAQEKHVVEKIKSTYKQIDMIFGTFALQELPKLMYEVLNGRCFADDTKEYPYRLNENIPAVRTSSFKASVPVMYGCNNFCSYCIVPYVRGREQSRTPEAVLSEISDLAQKGYKEIMLLGQNVNSYGKNLDNPISFSELLRRADSIDGDFKIRFMSSHPKDATHELIDTIAECKKICKHLHLPLQSGSNRILYEMNRHYTIEQYMDIVSYARKKITDFSLSTDIIVGFPNETYEDFLMTGTAVEKIQFDNIYSFIYSKRSGTKAASIEDHTSEEDKGKWMRELLALQREISTERYKRFIGKTLTVLFDSESRQDGRLSGKSDEFIIVEALCSDKSIIGRRKQVRITEAHNWALIGDII